MNKKVIIISAIIIPALLIGGILVATMNKNPTKQPQQDTTQSNQVEQAANQVSINEYAFTPAVLKVKKGTTVVWVNQDSAAHTVETSDKESAEQVMTSPLLKKGERHSITFNTVGTFNYLCGPHPYMKGSVEVTES